jgi:hypothetical protein
MLVAKQGGSIIKRFVTWAYASCDLEHFFLVKGLPSILRLNCLSREIATHLASKEMDVMNILILKRVNLTFVALKERLLSSQHFNHLGVTSL